MLRLQESLERRGRGRGRVQGLVLKPSSARPCAVWGNGLWGSVGRAGRSLPLEGLHQLWLFKPSRPCISVTVVTVARDCHHPEFAPADEPRSPSPFCVVFSSAHNCL